MGEGDTVGLFERIFGPKAPNVTAAKDGYFQSLTAYRPVFRSWGGRLYESELVRSAIDARARHISKLQVDFAGSAKPRFKTSIRTAPNTWQTWSQFLYRLSTILDMQNSAFIVPVLNEYGDISGYFPVLPSSCEVVESAGRVWLRYRFNNGKTAAIEYERCGVMTKFQYEDDFFGEANNALRQTMELVNMQNQGITEGIKNSATFRFMARIGNFTKPDDLAKERKRFNRENLQDESGGILLFPSTYTDIKQMQSAPYVVDAAQMQLIQTNVFNYFGVNAKILQNDAIGDALDGFFDGAIEPFTVQLSDVLTGMTYTARERANGNKVVVTANRLQYMSMGTKISMAKELGDRGILKIDEIRALFNYEPLPDGAGQHNPIRGEFYMADEGKGDTDVDEPKQGVSSDEPDANQAGG